MARTPEQILRDVIGGQVIQIAAQQAEIERLQAELAKRPSVPDPPQAG